MSSRLGPFETCFVLPCAGRRNPVRRHRFRLLLPITVLVCGSVAYFGCGGDVPHSVLPAPEYERPTVMPWPPTADAGSHSAPSRESNAPEEDAGNTTDSTETRQP